MEPADYVELGSLIPLEDGSYLDTETDTRFYLDEDGNPINEQGEYLIPPDEEV